MEQKNGQKQQNSTTDPVAQRDGMEIIYYTDPLCCWSWAMETHWQQFRQELPPGITIIYKMGGLLPSWNLFRDEVNSIRKPAQMGPEWMHARHVSGIEIDDRLWIIDPPASSFPACIAVKSAELQSPVFGTVYLGMVREAALLRCKNIARTEVLMDLALELAENDASFDLGRFRNDLNGMGAEAFKKDWKEAKYLGINRFPTLVFKAPGRQSILLSGYQSYNSLKEHWDRIIVEL
jgi:predicted DsbA family dithiol-disulfide isomerase